jgi:transcriptional regulator with XRE-family HTH domain
MHSQLNESSTPQSGGESPADLGHRRGVTKPVPARVRARRLALGLSQDELAAAANVSQSRLSRFERGEADLDDTAARRVAITLKTTLEALAAPEGEVALERDEPPLPRAVAAIDPDEVSALELALGRAFDPDRHQPRDLEAVLRIVRGMHFRLREEYDLVAAARQWLDAGSALRKEDVEVTSTSLLWRMTMGKNAGPSRG